MTERTDTPRRIALHACCGPCLLEPYDALAGEPGEVVVVFHNPNIHPAEEYAQRRDTLRAHCDAAGIEVVELAYEPQKWFESAGRFGGDREQRCRACYRLRLGETARWAAEHGCDAIATTLTVSPYQDHASIAEEGRTVAAEAGVEYVENDFRDRYSEATRRSRELGMYRQNYCGCVMSEAEAREEREARKAARAAAREKASGGEGR